MPTQPVVVYSGNKVNEQDKLAKIMMTEKLAQGVQGFSDMINKGVESYQRIKAQSQAKELAAISAAGSLVGGVDKLPVETRNKLPGILNIDLPRDAQGNVVLTPSAQDIINRSTADAAAANPEQFGRVKAGLQQPARDPQEIALDIEKEKTTRRSAELTFEAKQAEIAANREQARLDRAQKEEANIRDNDTKRDTAGASGDARVERGKEPSDFWVDLKTGDTLSKPAAEMSLESGQSLTDRYWNPSNDALKQHNEGRRAKAQATRAEANNTLDVSRQKLIEARVKQIASKDPEGLKFIMDGVRDANAMLAKGAPGAQEALDYWTKEMMTKLGKEAPPSDYGWMMQYMPNALKAAMGWQELKTGRGADMNTAKPDPAKATPVKAAEPAKSETLEDLMKRYE
jgi:hypothetical protein